ncbi:MAG TPA: ankyrin repeat domain-containing protein [Vicinamibacterales bacterium]|nr:ankyrin repeat domain-containing protein [Vicinamibacterales bacterium]
MTTPKSLPARPSLQSLRKQAKKLSRDRSLPLHDAQLALAREYGYPGWTDLTVEVSKRLGEGLEWAVAEAKRLIHDNDVDRLKSLLAEHPALLSWHGDDVDTPGLVGFATGSYGDSFDPDAEEHFTRARCAEVLIDAGAVVMPVVCDGLLRTHARGLLELFQRKGLLPRTLKFLVALGEIDGVRTALEENGKDLASVTEAFTVAWGLHHQAIALFLLDRAIVLDPELGTKVDSSIGRAAFVKYFIENAPGHATDVGLWKAFVMEQVSRAVSSWHGHEPSLVSPKGHSDLTTFVGLMERERWLLGDAFVEFQADIIDSATRKNRGEFITALFDLDPAILRRQPPPISQNIEFAFTYARTHLLPLLTRIWPLPDDLPHAAGLGDLARVKRWFDESGAPALGDVSNHYPLSPYMPNGRVEEYGNQFGSHSVQRILDSAFAWAVMNSHFDVADFLLEHGANINTTWSSHEPASILHELVWHRNYEAMQFLIDRGIDMTTRDYRWNATAQGWAFHAKDEKLAHWLEEKEREREGKSDGTDAR